MAGIEMTAENLKADPRTGLELIDVPPEYQSSFPDLAGIVMHWFSKVMVVNMRKSTGRERVVSKILLISDSCVYILEAGGMAVRCSPIRDIHEAITTLDNDIALRFPEAPDRYDMKLLLDTAGSREAVLNILSRIYAFHNDRPLPHRRLDPNASRELLQLRKPDGWQLRIETIIPKKLLVQQLQSQRDGYQAEQNLIADEFDRVKQKLERELDQQVQKRNEEFAQFKAEYQHLQDAHNNLVAQYDAMAQDVEAYVRMLQEKDDEIDRYKRGDHPRIKEIENEVQKMQLVRDLEEQKKQGASEKVLVERDQELRYAREQLQAKNDGESRLQALLRQKEEQLAAAEQAVRERDQLLHLKQVDAAEKEGRIAEKERELRYTKSLMRNTFRRQVEELELIRSQFQQYDDQMIAFITRLSHTPLTPAARTEELGDIPRPSFNFSTSLTPAPATNFNSVFK
ncbi:hypothetical protein DIPPA_02301 [Diplonema papillatum]|nr:hypothetical protein DIPPA_02301 [Diplonema papillatum]